MSEEPTTFWQHLDIMRGGLIRSAVVVLAAAVGMFLMREPLFQFILWPLQADFPTWNLLTRLGMMDSLPEAQLINTELARQFIVHIEAALWVGLVIALPYLGFEVVRFVRPALYESERRHLLPVVIAAYLLFMAGIVLAYWVLFPFTYLFLADYQVAGSVTNWISLSSYASTMGLMCLVMGLMAEMPIVSRLLWRLGLITRAGMHRYRRHAIVAIFILAAVITPTGDAFTLCLVAMPIWLLYELSAVVIR
jgi:sec-independent protein translocase protein TatC